MRKGFCDQQLIYLSVSLIRDMTSHLKSSIFATFNKKGRVFYMQKSNNIFSSKKKKKKRKIIHAKIRSCIVRLKGKSRIWCNFQHLSWRNFCYCCLSYLSHSHRIIEAGKDCQVHPIQPHPTVTTSPSATSLHSSNTSRDGDSNTSLSSPCQFITILSENKLFLVSNLNLPWCNLRPERRL